MRGAEGTLFSAIVSEILPVSVQTRALLTNGETLQARRFDLSIDSGTAVFQRRSDRADFTRNASLRASSASSLSAAQKENLSRRPLSSIVLARHNV
jgi:hypothetical protein